MKCDCCGIPAKCLEFKYLVHIENIINGTALMVNHVDVDGNSVSNKVVVKNICNKCYNQIMVEAVKKYNQLTESK